MSRCGASGVYGSKSVRELGVQVCSEVRTARTAVAKQGVDVCVLSRPLLWHSAVQSETSLGKVRQGLTAHIGHRFTLRDRQAWV